MILKPIIYLWAGLNAVDDLTMLFRVVRLGAVLVPGNGQANLCDVCDDVMGDLLKGTDGLEALPCQWACLGVPKCMRMCERVKAASLNSTHYPCVAAGYCVDGEIDSVDECTVGPFFTCNPSRYCVRKRKGFRVSCELRPGIGRWIGMRNAVGTHAAALTEGLWKQPHCGEPGAGPYCIAEPKGVGALAEGVGHVLSVVYGGWSTIVSIESPGGDDDRQWLTFWLILTLLLFVERYLARVLLSTVPLYYELKLLALLWLLFRDGADDVYRVLRRAVTSTVGGRWLANRQRTADLEELAILRRDCQEVVEIALREESERRLELRERSSRRDSREWLQRCALAGAHAADSYEEVEDEEGNGGAALVDDLAAVLLGASPATPRTVQRVERQIASAPEEDLSVRQLDEALSIVSHYLLTEEGSRSLALTNLGRSSRALLVERAAARVSFQPRFVTVDVVGTANGAQSSLPAMDSNGKSDAYVTCRLLSPGVPPYPARGVSTRTVYAERAPQWNQPLELTLEGGKVDQGGIFHSAEVVLRTSLLLQVYDADMGVWGWVNKLALLAVSLLVTAWAAAHISGLTDNLTRRQYVAGLAAAMLLVATALLSFVAYKAYGSDDEQIGEVVVPLHMLMDQRRHTLLLPLRLPRPSPAADGSDGEAAAGDRRAAGEHGMRNEAGGLGVICVRLSCSER